MNILSENNIYLKRSNEYEDLMGKIPPFFTRWSITIIFIIFICLVIALSCIEYNDTFKANVEIIQNKGQFNTYIYVSEKDWTLVQMGQKVIIHLYSYPESKYGIIEGVIPELHCISQNNGLYCILINTSTDFENFTNFKKANSHKGYCEVIVSSHSVIGKAFL